MKIDQQATKPSKNVKKVMWSPNRAVPSETYYEFQGMKFFARTVQPVSDEVFEAAKNLHDFKVVESVRNTVYTYDNPEGISGKLLGSIMDTNEFFTGGNI